MLCAQSFALAAAPVSLGGGGEFENGGGGERERERERDRERERERKREREEERVNKSLRLEIKSGLIAPDCTVSLPLFSPHTYIHIHTYTYTHARTLTHRRSQPPYPLVLLAALTPAAATLPSSQWDLGARLDSGCVPRECSVSISHLRLLKPIDLGDHGRNELLKVAAGGVLIAVSMEVGAQRRTRGGPRSFG